MLWTDFAQQEPDLAERGRVLLADDEEFSVRGVVREVEDADARQAAVVGARGGAQLSAALTLFEVDLVEVGWARWSLGKPTRKRWQAEGVSPSGC
ncbi:hypothetical protein ABZ915_43295 [Streptomyces sp. NPDC046915]|uniref:hypothetical protein n=1 Tax=Streptomyces sp. NPDC046915 TaxID=3155257 RepID=UPI0033E105C4